MAWVEPGWGNSRTNAVQKILGNSQPPNLAKINSNMLKAASPKMFNLAEAKTDTTKQDAATAKCREYKDMKGLRQLQEDQKNFTVYDAGCGWQYKNDTGFNPFSQGAFGDKDGPFRGSSGDIDELKGATWYKNLDAAELLMSRDISTKMGGLCANLANLSSDNKAYFGYCTSSQKTIPIITKAGVSSARYPNNPSFACLPANIVTADNCPQGFTNLRQGMGVKGDLREAFKGSTPRSFTRETFVGGTCEPLTDANRKACYDEVFLAQGCSTEGSYHKLSSGTGNAADLNLATMYGDAVNASSIYPTMADAPGFFRDMQMNTQGRSGVPKKTTALARDLCLKSGTFDSDISWCKDEMTSGTKITSANIKCIQAIWRNEGGTPKGTDYPVMGKYADYSNFTDKLISLKRDIQSTTFSVQKDAIMRFIGTSTASTRYNHTIKSTQSGIYLDAASHSEFTTLDAAKASCATLKNCIGITYNTERPNSYTVYSPMNDGDITDDNIGCRSAPSMNDKVDFMVEIPDKCKTPSTSTSTSTGTDTSTGTGTSTSTSTSTGTSTSTSTSTGTTTSSCPAKGMLSSTGDCDGTTKYSKEHDGNCGTTIINVETNSPDCGYYVNCEIDWDNSPWSECTSTGVEEKGTQDRQTKIKTHYSGNGKTCQAIENENPTKMTRDCWYPGQSTESNSKVMHLCSPTGTSSDNCPGKTRVGRFCYTASDSACPAPNVPSTVPNVPNVPSITPVDKLCVKNIMNPNIEYSNYNADSVPICNQGYTYYKEGNYCYLNNCIQSSCDEEILRPNNQECSKGYTYNDITKRCKPDRCIASDPNLILG